MVRWPDEAAHHLRVHELKFARYDVFNPDYFELTFCLPWLGAWMTVPDDEKFLSKQVRAKVRNVWQLRFCCIKRSCLASGWSAGDCGWHAGN